MSIQDHVSKLDNIVNYHNKNLTKSQYYDLGELLDHLKTKKFSSQDVDKLDNIVHYHNKNLNQSQYYALEELLDELESIANSKKTRTRKVTSGYKLPTQSQLSRGF